MRSFNRSILIDYILGACHLCLRASPRATAPPNNIALLETTLPTKNLAVLSMTSSTMRLNEDILNIILDRFSNRCDRESARALVNMATTCKGFHQPALRVIWREISDLFPLFSLFSAFAKVRVLTRGTLDGPFAEEEEMDLYVSNPPTS